MEPNHQGLWLLLVLFNLKHFAADFLLQSKWMVFGKKGTLPGSLLPLSAHSMVHALGAVLIAVFFTEANSQLILYIFLIDFLIHGVMDLIKSHPKLWGRYSESDGHVYFMIFGFDQLIHQLTNLLIVCMLVTA